MGSGEMGNDSDQKVFYSKHDDSFLARFSKLKTDVEKYCHDEQSEIRRIRLENRRRAKKGRREVRLSQGAANRR